MHYFDNEAAWEAFRAEAESWLGTPYQTKRKRICE